VKLANVLHANALGRAQDAIQQAYTRPDAQLFDLEMALANSENEGLHRLALAALIAQSKQGSGWSRRVRVRRLVSVSARRRKHDRLPGGHGPHIGGCGRVLRFSVAWTVARGLGETLRRHPNGITLIDRRRQKRGAAR